MSTVFTTDIRRCKVSCRRATSPPAGAERRSRTFTHERTGSEKTGFWLISAHRPPWTGRPFVLAEDSLDGDVAGTILFAFRSRRSNGRPSRRHHRGGRRGCPAAPPPSPNHRPPHPAGLGRATKHAARIADSYRPLGRFGLQFGRKCAQPGKVYPVWRSTGPQPDKCTCQWCHRTGLTHNPAAGGRRGGVPRTTTWMWTGVAGWVGARGDRGGRTPGSAAARSVTARSWAARCAGSRSRV